MTTIRIGISKRWQHLTIVGALALCASLSQSAPREVFIPVPSSMENTEFYLLTVFRGESLPARYGHTMVRVKDSQQGIDYLLNWGTFDFDAPNFGLNFYRGILNYHLSKAGVQRTLQFYQQIDKRGVVQERMVFTPAQKLEFFDLIRENAQPENLTYSYHQFYDNCATRIRDLLDQVFDGQLRAKYADVETSKTFRDRVREGFDGQWWSYLGIEMSTNSEFDLPMTPWHEMFLPVALRDYLKAFQARDDQGNKLDSPFLVETEVLVDLPLPPTGPNPVYVSGFVALLIVGLCFGPILWRREARPSLVRLAAFGGILLSLWSAIFGSVFVLNWLIATQRPELHHNALLWLFGPWDWCLVFVLSTALWRGSLPARDDFGGKVLFWLSLAHIMGFCILFVARLFGLIEQDVTPFLMGWAPALLLAWTAIMLGFGTWTWPFKPQTQPKADNGQAQAV